MKGNNSSESKQADKTPKNTANKNSVAKKRTQQAKKKTTTIIVKNSDFVDDSTKESDNWGSESPGLGLKPHAKKVVNNKDLPSPKSENNTSSFKTTKKKANLSGSVKNVLPLSQVGPPKAKRKISLSKSNPQTPPNPTAGNNSKVFKTQTSLQNNPVSKSHPVKNEGSKTLAPPKPARKISRSKSPPTTTTAKKKRPLMRINSTPSLHKSTSSQTPSPKVNSQSKTIVQKPSSIAPAAASAATVKPVKTVRIAEDVKVRQIQNRFEPVQPPPMVARKLERRKSFESSEEEKTARRKSLEIYYPRRRFSQSAIEPIREMLLEIEKENQEEKETEAAKKQKKKRGNSRKKNSSSRSSIGAESFVPIDVSDPKFQSLSREEQLERLQANSEKAR